MNVPDKPEYLKPETLQSIVEENDRRWGRIFDLAIQILIVVSLASFSLETIPDVAARYEQLLYLIEVVTTIVFTVEYLIRLSVAENKLKFAFSFYGIVDLLAVLPFYLSLGLDLRSLRAVRLLRLFRAFKLVRYSRAMQRFHRALMIAKEEAILFLIVTLILIYFAAVGIYYFEHDRQPDGFKSVFHSLWWAVVTLTTVGYGDVYPVTIGGRIFTFFIILIGLGIVAFPAGLVASALAQARELEDQEELEDQNELERMGQEPPEVD